MNNNIDRAKQFLAFEALKGLDEALKEKERLSVNKKSFFKDEQANLSYKLAQLKKGMVVELIYYENQEYQRLCGVITNIDYNLKSLIMIDKKINFIDIIMIQGEDIIEKVIIIVYNYFDNAKK